MAMSRIRHFVWSTQSDARNCSGDENARAANPNSFIKSGTDSRTDSSSSTTDTSERVTVIEFSRGACRHKLGGRQDPFVRTGLVEEIDVLAAERCPYQMRAAQGRQACSAEKSFSAHA